MESLEGPSATDVTGYATLGVFPGTPTNGLDLEVTPPVGSGLLATTVPYNGSITGETTLVVTLSGISGPPPPPAVTFSGVLDDASGSPVAGATVSLSSGGTTAASATTGADGSFSLDPSPGIYTAQIALPQTGEFADISASFSATVDLSSTSLTGETLTLPPLVALNALVQDPAGDPMADASVQYTSASGGSPSLTVAADQLFAGIAEAGTAQGSETLLSTTVGTTDSTGTVGESVFAGTLQNGLTIGVSVPSLHILGVSQTYSGSAISTDTTIPVTVPVSTFSGVLDDANGNPVAGATICLGYFYGREWASTTTGPDGSFTLIARSNPYTVQIIPAQTGEFAGDGEAYFTGSVDLSSDLTGVTFTLPPLVSLKAVVQDSLGDPVPGAAVSFSLSTAADQVFGGAAAPGAFCQYWNTPGGTTDASGSVTMRLFAGTQLSSGVMAVTPATGSGLAPVTFPYTFPITGNATIVATVASLSGSLINPSGNALSGQSVALRASDGATAAQTTTASDGSFALSVAPGTYTVDLSGSLGDPTTYYVSVPGVDLSNGQQGTFTLPTEAMNVVVTDQNGVPVPGATVQCSDAATSFALFGGTASGTQSASETTDVTGTAALQLLPASSVSLTVTPPVGSRLVAATTTVTPSAGGTVDVELGPPPALITSLLSDAIVGTPYSYQLAASGGSGTLTYSATGLPDWLSLSPSGLLSGIPHEAGATSFAVTVTDQNGTSSAPVTLSLTADQPPAFISTGSDTTLANTAFSYLVSGSGWPTPAFSASGMPPWLTLIDQQNGSATLSGMPTAAGTYSFTLSASNSIGSVTQSFTLIVTQAPAITSASSVTATTGKALSFQFAASGYPAPTFSETGALPSGLALSAAGLLSGTPAAGTGGVYAITVTAQNSAGQATQSFTLTVDQAPAFTSAASATATVGKALSFQASASGYPAPTFSESGTLPKGVSFSSAGLFSGTPAAGTAGTYAITLTASSSVGSVTQGFTLTVTQAPAITSASSVTATTGKALSFQLTATGYPAPSFSETGALPGGVTLSSAGLVSGTPAAGSGGSYPITVTATNSAGSATQVFTLTVDQPPAFSSPASATATVGKAFSFQATATGYPAPTFTECGTLPKALSFSAGTISGTPAAATAGSYAITLSASNSIGSVTQKFTLTVAKS